jgi:glutathione peroxidase-family protein
MKQASSVLGHSFQDALGKTVSMDSLLGKAVLVVNVASE